MAKKYANIELQIKSISTLSLGNSANYQNTAHWGNTIGGNVTTVGSNGNPSPYGLYDTMGQLYEWTETFDSKFPQLKYIRGGCYADQNPASLISIKKFLFNNMLEEGCFGFRIASYNNDNNYNNLISVTGSSSYDNTIYDASSECDNKLNNLVVVDPKTEKNIGLVTYDFMIGKYPVTNAEYCEYLNSIDISGTNTEIYDYKMDWSHIGGIHLKQSFENPTSGSYYTPKPNMHNKPVAFITWLMAAKYCNWLSSNKSNDPSVIYTGSYDLSVMPNNKTPTIWTNKGYEKGDVVYHNNKPYICTKTFNNNLITPDITVKYTDTQLRGSPFTSANFLTENGGSTVTSEPSPFDSVPDDGDIVLFQNFQDPKNNGIYVLSQVLLDNEPVFGLFKATRLAPYTNGSSINNSFRVNVTNGNANAVASYILNANQNGNSTIGSDNLVFTSAPSINSNTNPELWISENYNSIEKRWIEFLTRQSTASYFLPSNNEWHKAALYHPTQNTYWKYSTSQFSTPKPIICDSIGSGYNVVGYFEPSIKTFPIVVTKEIEDVVIKPKKFTATTTSSSTPANFQNNVYFVNTAISGASSGITYNYYYSSASGTDWPSYITPISGSFVSNNGIYNINSILKFCPLSRYEDSGITCLSNLDYQPDNNKTSNNIAEQGTGTLFLEFNVSGADGLSIRTTTPISGTNLPILPKDNVVDIALLTTSGNNIIVSGNLCDQYVPIVAIAKPANTYTKIGETYNYVFKANNNKVSIVPASGQFSLSNTTTKITSILRLNDVKNTSLSIEIFKPESSFTNIDYVNIICLDECE